jgi:hypothetical protein
LPPRGVGEAFKASEKGLVGASDSLDLEGEGVPVEAGRRDHPGGLVAAVYRQRIGAHPLMIPPGMEDPVCIVPANRRGKLLHRSHREAGDEPADPLRRGDEDEGV